MGKLVAINIIVGPTHEREPDQSERSFTLNGGTQGWAFSGQAFPRDLKLLDAISDAVRDWHDGSPPAARRGPA